MSFAGAFWGGAAQAHDDSRRKWRELWLTEEELQQREDQFTQVQDLRERQLTFDKYRFETEEARAQTELSHTKWLDGERVELDQIRASIEADTLEAGTLDSYFSNVYDRWGSMTPTQRAQYYQTLHDANLYDNPLVSANLIMLDSIVEDGLTGRDANAILDTFLNLEHGQYMSMGQVRAALGVVKAQMPDSEYKELASFVDELHDMYREGRIEDLDADQHRRALSLLDLEAGIDLARAQTSQIEHDIYERLERLNLDKETHTNLMEHGRLTNQLLELAVAEEGLRLDYLPAQLSATVRQMIAEADKAGIEADFHEEYLGNVVRELAARADISEEEARSLVATGLIRDAIMETNLEEARALVKLVNADIAVRHVTVADIRSQMDERVARLNLDTETQSAVLERLDREIQQLDQALAEGDIMLNALPAQIEAAAAKMAAELDILHEDARHLIETGLLRDAHVAEDVERIRALNLLTTVQTEDIQAQREESIARLDMDETTHARLMDQLDLEIRGLQTGLKREALELAHLPEQLTLASRRLEAETGIAEETARELIATGMIREALLEADLEGALALIELTGADIGLREAQTRGLDAETEGALNREKRARIEHVQTLINTGNIEMIDALGPALLAPFLGEELAQETMAKIRERTTTMRNSFDRAREAELQILHADAQVAHNTVTDRTRAATAAARTAEAEAGQAEKTLIYWDSDRAFAQIMAASQAESQRISAGASATSAAASMVSAYANQSVADSRALLVPSEQSVNESRAGAYDAQAALDRQQVASMALALEEGPTLSLEDAHKAAQNTTKTDVSTLIDLTQSLQNTAAEYEHAAELYEAGAYTQLDDLVQQLGFSDVTAEEGLRLLQARYENELNAVMSQYRAYDNALLGTAHAPNWTEYGLDIIDDPLHYQLYQGIVNGRAASQIDRGNLKVAQYEISDSVQMVLMPLLPTMEASGPEFIARHLHDLLMEDEGISEEQMREAGYDDPSDLLPVIELELDRFQEAGTVVVELASRLWPDREYDLQNSNDLYRLQQAGINRVNNYNDLIVFALDTTPVIDWEELAADPSQAERIIDQHQTLIATLEEAGYNLDQMESNGWVTTIPIFGGVPIVRHGALVSDLTTEQTYYANALGPVGDMISRYHNR